MDYQNCCKKKLHLHSNTIMGGAFPCNPSIHSKLHQLLKNSIPKKAQVIYIIKLDIHELVSSNT